MTKSAIDISNVTRKQSYLFSLCNKDKLIAEIENCDVFADNNADRRIRYLIDKVFSVVRNIDLFDGLDKQDENIIENKRYPNITIDNTTKKGILIMLYFFSVHICIWINLNQEYVWEIDILQNGYIAEQIRSKNNDIDLVLHKIIENWIIEFKF